MKRNTFFYTACSFTVGMYLSRYAPGMHGNKKHEAYRDFKNMELSGYVNKIKRYIHPYVMLTEYKGIGSKKIVSRATSENGVACGNKILTLNHLLETEDYRMGFIERNGHKKIEQFEKTGREEYFLVENKQMVRIEPVTRDKKNDTAIFQYSRFGLFGERAIDINGEPCKIENLKNLGDSNVLKKGNFVFTVKMNGGYGDGIVSGLEAPRLGGTPLIERHGKEFLLADGELLDKNAFFSHTIDTTYGDSGSPVFAIMNEPELVGFIRGKLNDEDGGGPDVLIGVKINEFKYYM